MTETGYKQELRRTLHLYDLVLYGIVMMSPIAVFAVYGSVQAAAGSGVVLAYGLGCIAMMLTALSYASMAKSVPVAGSVYHYARASMGQAFGFIAGWAILLDYILLPALMILLGGVVMNTAIPAIPVPGWVVIFLVISTGVNLLGIKMTTRADTTIAIILVAVVALFIVSGLLTLYGGAGAGQLTLNPIIPVEGFQLNLVVTGASVAVLTFLGFDAISTLAEEVTGGDTGAVGRATIFCLLVMGGLYIVVSWLLTDLGVGVTIASPDTASFDIVQTRLPWLFLPLTLAVGLGTGIGSAIPPQAAVSRVLYAMARDRMLPAPLAWISERYQTPWVSLILIAIVMATVALGFVDHLGLLFTLVNFGALVAFLFVNAAVIVFHGVKGKSRNWLRHWVLPALGFAVIAYVLSGLNLAAIELGLVWLAIGLAYYLVMRFAFGRSGELAIDTASE